ncbi:synaptotagmin-12-like [Schistocerca serialis cubense]|uniref:synaptotagmin-12-like n=1 Tax=Schistocerca serialis cubense TaxID=2023355 RepID=UPI00214F51C1|nr:synaptotagmin-12-like [Schistocerca serialis cubense]
MSALAALVVLALVALVVVAACRVLGLWTWLAAWVASPREEKVALTRVDGHYDANGVLSTTSPSVVAWQQLRGVAVAEQRDGRRRAGGVEEAGLHLGRREFSWRATCQPARLALARFSTSPAINAPPATGGLKQTLCSPTSVDPVLSDSLFVNSTAYASSFHPTLSTGVCIRMVRAESDTSLEVALRFGGAAAAAAGVCDVPAGLRRAASCESVCSDTSVVLGDLQEAPVAGYLCVGLESDSSGELVVTVLEAKELADSPDSYVRLSLSPDRNCVVQTRVYRRSSCPSYKEKFVFSLDPAELSRRTLSLQVFATDKEVTTLLGEAELRLSDISMRQPVTTWLTLTDTGQHGTEWGEVMFSLSYLPTAERLTVVIVKARNLRFSTDPVPGDPFVKVYLLQHGKKVHKKKTTTKRGERCPIFNEAMIFSVPAHALQTIQLRVTVAENTGEPRARAVGHVIVGAQATGKALSHWSQMLSSLRKPIAMWHVLRK